MNPWVKFEEEKNLNAITSQIGVSTTKGAKYNDLLTDRGGVPSSSTVTVSRYSC